MRLDRTLKFKANAFLASLNRFQFLDSREPRVYSVGLPRSGTRSIADILSDEFRTAHEPLHRETIFHLLEWKKGVYDDEKISSILLHRDKKLNIRVESSHYMHYFLEILLDLFSDARFILTVREPLGWLESEFSKNIREEHPRYWKALEDYRYSRYINEYKFRKLKYVSNARPIKSYLDYYVEHLKKVIKCVPKKKLLVIKTSKINNSINKIAKFIGKKYSNIRFKKEHSNEGNSEVKIYDYVDKSRIVRQLKNHRCSKFLNRHLPEVVSKVDYM